MAVHLVCPWGEGGGTVQGTNTHRGPQAICSLGPGEQPRPLLGTRVQLSHEPCRVVVITTAATGPACRKKHGCRRMLPHRHSIVCSRARENGGGEMWEEVHVYEITESRNQAVAEQTREASRSPRPSAFPLRQDEFQVVLPACSPLPPGYAPCHFGTAYLENAAKKMGYILRYIIDFAFENLVIYNCPHFPCSLQET